MERQEIVDELTSVFRKVFEDDSITIHDETTAEDIDNWDSMTHLMLISEVEAHFDISMSGGEIMNLHNVGSLIDLVGSKK